MRVKAVVAVLAMLAVPAISMAAPSWSGVDTTVDASALPTSVNLVANLNTDGNTISGYQHALIAPAGGFTFNAITINPATGFAQTDIVFGPPAAGSALPTAAGTGGEVSVFAFSGGDRAAYNGAAETWNIGVPASVGPGDYAFMIADSGAGFFMANANSPDGIPFGAGTAFTLHVTPEPVSALLLLAGLPLLRRRQAA